MFGRLSVLLVKRQNVYTAWELVSRLFGGGRGGCPARRRPDDEQKVAAGGCGPG